jgi:hypothetical protein
MGDLRGFEWLRFNESDLQMEIDHHIISHNKNSSIVSY